MVVLIDKRHHLDAGLKFEGIRPAGVIGLGLK